MDAHPTEPARRVVELAREEALLLGGPDAGTGHLLLGLLREERGVAVRALAAAGLTQGTVRSLLRERPSTAPEAEDGMSAGNIELSTEAKSVVGRARPEAWRLGAAKAGTEHLLLSLLKDPEGRAVGMLAAAGVDPEGLKTEVLRMVGEGQNDGVTAEELREEAQRLREAADALNEAYGRSLWRLMLPGIVSSLTLGAAVGAGVYAAITLSRKR